MAGTGPWVPDNAIEVPCEKCGAGILQDCRRPDGEIAARLHAARVELAKICVNEHQWEGPYCTECPKIEAQISAAVAASQLFVEASP